MSRLKVLALFAFLGFVAGIAGKAAYQEVYPILLTIYPGILQVEWILSGLAGALLTTIMVVLWAYQSGPS